MRIALDIQACQTASRHRGIGRYSLDLTKAILELSRNRDEILIGLDGMYPEAASEITSLLKESLAPAAISRYHYPGPNCAHGSGNDVLRPTAEILTARHYGALSADLVHVNSLFEGYAEHAASLTRLTNVVGAISSATLYDFIPLIFAQSYLGDADYSAWYSRKLAALHRFDVLLCISEATKRDAIALLGIPQERLSVIHAGVDPQFKPRFIGQADRNRLKQQYGITGRFVLYTGNGDFRKNLTGAVAAFAAIPQQVRNGVQLVLNQVDNEQFLFSLASRLGLSRADLIVTGMVSDAELINLFASCELFFFPSLYEGFGLPVLEAMACGAPTLAANNSSLPEIVGRPDALFDADRVDDITALLARGLTDAGFRQSLSEHGIEQARKFNWERSGALALSAWKSAFEKKKLGDPRVVVAEFRRLKIAMITPLPPERTGIAGYINDLLLPLARHMDVDLYTTADIHELGALRYQFNVRPWQQFENNAGDYDQIIYQFGNSPFHSHMLTLLDRFPGVVVLHDFFLSSMLAYMDEQQDYEGIFRRELQYSHGRGASFFLDSEGKEKAKVRFPASRRIIESATAVLVHSDYSQRLCEKFFPFLARGIYRKIPMPQIITPRREEARRQHARLHLGFGCDDFVIVAFGFLAETKLNHILLSALEDGRFSADDSIRLIFVGENDGGDYGKEISRRVSIHPIGKRIKITGFAPENAYREYLLAADCAVQLRAMSRGETSKAVFDCMSNDLTVIVNDYASFGELPDDVVGKVSAEVSSFELAEKLFSLKSNPSLRRELADAARSYILRFHSADIVAAHYASAIHEAMRARDANSSDSLVREIGIIFSQSSFSEEEFNSVAHALRQTKQSKSNIRIYLDLSEVVTTDYGTGIHRVVRNLARELILAERPTEVTCIPIAHTEEGVVISAEDYVVAKLSIPRSENSFKFCPAAGDVFFLLDSAWQKPERFLESIFQVRQRGGQIAAIVFDLIPIRYPQYCIEFMPPIFEEWLRFIVEHCDFIVCISKATAEDLMRWIEETMPSRLGIIRIHHFHLGSNLERNGSDMPPSQEIISAMQGSRSVLMVGTLEPRKRYDTALDAFDRLWSAGSDYRLVILGKPGWGTELLVERIQKHSQYGHRLIWIRHCSDIDLKYAYEKAAQLLQASETEGFGLPIVEAAHFGCPLLLSDIPVFREIAGDSAEYFPMGNSAALSRTLAGSPGHKPDSVKTRSWKACANELLGLLCNRT